MYKFENFFHIGENGNTTEGITKEKILNQPLLEEGTFLSYASKVMRQIYVYIYIFIDMYIVENKIKIQGK